VRVLILAGTVINPDNTPNGYYWTFLFPMLLFIFIGTILYLLFSRPHRRIPARAIRYPGASAQGSWAHPATASSGRGATAVSDAPAPAAEAGSAAAPEDASDGEQAEGDAASAGDAESSE
jgi:hypothetical protein